MVRSCFVDHLAYLEDVICAELAYIVYSQVLHADLCTGKVCFIGDFVY